MNRPVRDRVRPPALPLPVEAKLPPSERFTLTNGLEVAHAPLHALPLVAVRLVVRAGAAADAHGLGGRASLTAEVLDEGTRHRSALDIATLLETLGADFAVSADWDQTVVVLQVLPARLEAALGLLSEIVTEPAFAAEEFARKKRERLLALLQDRDEPAVLASRAFAAHVYGDRHAYGNAVAGDARSVEALDRDALVRFHQAHYRPAGAFLVVTGDVRSGRLRPLLERVFEGWSCGPPVPVPQPARPAPRATAVRIVDRPAAPQSELRIGHAGPPRTTGDYFPLVVMNTILGGSFTSRLNTRLREEKGYTYGVRSSFAFRGGPGPFVVSTAVGTAATADAAADVLREIRRMREATVPAAELDRARNYLALGLPRRFETLDGISEHIADVLLHGLADDYYDHFMARVRAVSAAEVLEAAARHLDPDHTGIVLAGDFDAVAADLAGLGLGAVERVDVDPPGTPLA